MMLNFFRKEVLFGEVKNSIEKKIKRKIIKSELINSDFRYKVFNVLTNKENISLIISNNERNIKTELEILELCQKHDVPVPNVITWGNIDGEDKTFFIAQEIIGETLAKRNLNIFDYNKVLDEFAGVLFNIHSIEPDNYGFLNPGLRGAKKDWISFVVRDLDKQLTALRTEKILTPCVSEKIGKILNQTREITRKSLLHGQISAKAIHLNNKLEISCISGFHQSVSGDPAYEIAGFLVYEGWDRARRLTKIYHDLGGSVEWESEELLKNSLARSINLLYRAVISNQKYLISRRIRLTQEILFRFLVS